MAVTNQQIQFEYIADGTTTVFPFYCRVLLGDDLFVSLDGIEVNNFSVVGLNNDEGGSIVFDIAPIFGAKVLILRNIPLERETDYQTNGDFLAKTVNKDFDRIWMALQNVVSWFRRALTYPLGGMNYNAESRRIENLADPVNDQDAATKKYVDTEDAKLNDAINTLSGNLIQGWITLSSFEQGATLTLSNEVLLFEQDGQYYRWTGDLPKVVNANSTPDSTGGVIGGAWVLIGDGALRSQLAGQDGVSLVNNAVDVRLLNQQDGLKFIGQCQTIEMLRSIEPTIDNQRIDPRQESGQMQPL